MARASPSLVNFNGGEVSELLAFRSDLERYKSFNRAMRNCVPTPQGPVLRRSGTKFQNAAYQPSLQSALVPFVFADDQANVLEFCNVGMRILSDDGVLTHGFVDITAVVPNTPFKFTSAALVAQPGIAIGRQIAFTNFPAAQNMEGVVANIINIVGNDITVDINYNGATGAVSGPQGGLVFFRSSPYLAADVKNIRYVNSLDVVYLLCKGYPPHKLSRLSETNWTLLPVDFIDGPYLNEVTGGAFLTPSAIGKATVKHTAAATGGNTTSSSTDSGSDVSWRAFDESAITCWTSSVATSSSTFAEVWLKMTFGAAKIIEGYVIYGANRNDGQGFKAHRPTTWKLEGSNDDVNWVLLDSQTDYALWKYNRTQYITFANNTAYNRYRISLVRTEGDDVTVLPRIGEVVYREKGGVALTLTASSTTGINRDQGFLTTDVGRLMRIHQADGFWRPVKIIARNSTTQVVVELQGEPLFSLDEITRYRLGAYSATTGYPTTGAFFDDRLVLAGSVESPTAIALSEPQAYESFAPSDLDGTLQAANGMFLTPNTRNATPARWLMPTEKGLLIGFGSGEWFLGPNSTNNPFSATNFKASAASSRGSADVPPVRIDEEVLFTQANKRTVRKYGYALESDSYRSSSMSLFASHLGRMKWQQIVYCAEPFSIMWALREDGTLAGLTYNKDEGINGWHNHEFPNAFIESIASVPGLETNDDLWAVVRRVINGGTVRNVEKLMPFWDFDDTLETAHYVDCGRRVTSGSPFTVVNNVRHLETVNICGLADGKHFGFDSTVTVTGGQFTIPFEAENVVFGINFESYGETSNIEAGAQDGTAQGKVKRIHNMSLAVMDSYGGSVGVFNEDTFSAEVEPLFDTPLYRADGELGEPVLFTGIIGPFNPPQGYGKRGSIIYKQDRPYPFNVVALLPQLNVEDRG